MPRLRGRWRRRNRSREVRRNLEEIAEINARLVTEPPRTFREACQWMLWYQMAARMYNGSGSLGRLDVLLLPYYERDTAAGMLDRRRGDLPHRLPAAARHGLHPARRARCRRQDVTNPVSYLVLEAAHRLKIPANVGRVRRRRHRSRPAQARG